MSRSGEGSESGNSGGEEMVNILPPPSPIEIGPLAFSPITLPEEEESHEVVPAVAVVDSAAENVEDDFGVAEEGVEAAEEGVEAVEDFGVRVVSAQQLFTGRDRGRNA